MFDVFFLRVSAVGCFHAEVPKSARDCGERVGVAKAAPSWQSCETMDETAMFYFCKTHTLMWIYLYVYIYILWFALNVPFTCQWIPQGSSEAYVFTRCREGSGGVKVARIHLRDQSKENQIGGVRGSTVVVLWTRIVPWISYRSSISIVSINIGSGALWLRQTFFWWWLEG